MTTLHTPSQFAAAIAVAAATHAQPRPAPVTTELQARAPELIEYAHRWLLVQMRRHGNDLSKTHSTALRDLMVGFTNQALGIDTGRFAYAMPCGAGKTLGMVIWLASAWKLGIHISVAISASQIEALCKIKDKLIEYGVPEAVIGVRHSYGATARYPDTGDDDRPIMLLSHERIRQGRARELFCRHLGNARHLLLWDESLIASRAESLSWPAVKGAIHSVAELLPRPSLLRSALLDALAGLSDEVQRQRDDRGSQPLTLRLLGDIDLRAAQAELKGLRRYGPQQRYWMDTVRALLDLAQAPVSIALLQDGDCNDGLIHYSPVIDPELENIAVLDASFPVRTLARGGRIDDRTTSAMRGCKTYEAVSVIEHRFATGRHTLAANRARENELVRLIAEAYSATPAGGLLVITFKDDESRTTVPLRSLQAGLRRLGIDPETINWLTWGNETSLNEFGHCTHVFLAGIVRRSPLDLTAGAAGHADDLRYRMTRQELNDLALSEIAHCVLQGMNRGACRRVDAAGRAHKMTLTIVADVKGLRGVMLDCLPKINWPKPAAKTKAEHVVEALMTFLLSCRTRGRVSCRDAKAVVRASLGGDLKDDTWKAGRDAALKALAGAWSTDGQHFSRAAGA
jgi:hypothetical protein